MTAYHDEDENELEAISPSPAQGTVERAEPVAWRWAWKTATEDDGWTYSYFEPVDQSGDKIVQPLFAPPVDSDALKALREALEQIVAVCSDNAPATCRHDLALKFVADVAARALSSQGGGGSDDR